MKNSLPLFPTKFDNENSILLANHLHNETMPHVVMETENTNIIVKKKLLKEVAYHLLLFSMATKSH